MYISNVGTVSIMVIVIIHRIIFHINIIIVRVTFYVPTVAHTVYKLITFSL